MVRNCCLYSLELHFSYDFPDFTFRAGVPIEVREAFLAQAAARMALTNTPGAVGPNSTLAIASAAGTKGGPVSEVNRQYALMNAQRTLNDNPDAFSNAANILPEAHEALMKFGRSGVYHARNQAKLCSFFAKGECTRGDLCPYRHEMPRSKEDPLSKQNIVDRYYGVNDPVAAKMMGKAAVPGAAPVAPADPSVTTLWIHGVDGRVDEEGLEKAFSPYGAVSSIRLVPEKSCAFVEMGSRQAAEAAVQALFASLMVNGVALKVGWAKKSGSGGAGGSGETRENANSGNGNSGEQASASAAYGYPYGYGFPFMYGYPYPYPYGQASPGATNAPGQAATAAPQTKDEEENESTGNKEIEGSEKKETGKADVSDKKETSDTAPSPNAPAGFPPMPMMPPMMPGMMPPMFPPMMPGMPPMMPGMPPMMMPPMPAAPPANFSFVGVGKGGPMKRPATGLQQRKAAAAPYAAMNPSTYGSRPDTEKKE